MKVWEPGARMEGTTISLWIHFLLTYSNGTDSLHPREHLYLDRPFIGRIFLCIYTFFSYEYLSVKLVFLLCVQLSAKSVSIYYIWLKIKKIYRITFHYWIHLNVSIQSRVIVINLIIRMLCYAMFETIFPLKSSQC